MCKPSRASIKACNGSTKTLGFAAIQVGRSFSMLGWCGMKRLESYVGEGRNEPSDDERLEKLRTPSGVASNIYSVGTMTSRCWPARKAQR